MSLLSKKAHTHSARCLILVIGSVFSVGLFDEQLPSMHEPRQAFRELDF